MKVDALNVENVEKEDKLSANRLPLMGVLFGLALGAMVNWTSGLSDVWALRGIPIHSASFGLRPDAVALSVFINFVCAAFGGYLVARFHQRLGLALLYGAGVTAVGKVLTGYIQTIASLEGNDLAELILVRLPIGLFFGGVIWFLGGLVGSYLEHLALMLADRLWLARRAVIACGLMIGLGLALGVMAGGTSVERRNSIIAAQAVDGALRLAKGEQVSPRALPTGFFVSDPALALLKTMGVRLSQPYEFYSNNDAVYSDKAITDIHFQDGLVVRCVSNGAWISECYDTSAT